MALDIFLQQLTRRHWLVLSGTSLFGAVRLRFNQNDLLEEKGMVVINGWVLPAEYFKSGQT
jgi:hypothetical protein